MSERLCADWLADYMKYTAKLESPDTYHFWSGMSVVAACVRRRAWVNLGYFKVFANMYIVLVGPPAVRKNTAINAATYLITDNITDGEGGFSDVKMSADSTTREALIQAINKSTKIDEVNGKSYTHASLTIISKELSVFLGTGNTDLLALLTDLYDCHPRWEYRTKMSGIDSLTNMWLNMLGASTPDWLCGSIPITAIGGGFTSRVIFVVEDKVRQKVAIPKPTPAQLEIKKKLIHDLESISMVGGEFIMTPEAEAWYEDWYQNANKKLDDQRFHGYAERKHIHLLKVALIIAISRNSPNKITDGHMVLALSALDNIEENMVNAFGGAGASPLAPSVQTVINIIQTAGEISKTELVKQTWRDVDIRYLQQILFMIKDMGVVETYKKEADGDTYFKFVGG